MFNHNKSTSFWILQLIIYTYELTLKMRLKDIIIDPKIRKRFESFFILVFHQKCDCFQQKSLLIALLKLIQWVKSKPLFNFEIHDWKLTKVFLEHLEINSFDKQSGTLILMVFIKTGTSSFNHVSTKRFYAKRRWTFTLQVEETDYELKQD